MHEAQLEPTLVPLYLAPASLEEAIDLMAKYREKARVIAGGTDLIPELDRSGHPGLEALIDLTRIEGLDSILHDGRRIHIGPAATHNQCVTNGDVVQYALPLAQACVEVASPALRNRATVVGNIVTASPANDTISALRVLDAVVTLMSTRGRRQVPLDEFHLGPRKTVMEPDELVTGISLEPVPETARAIFVKLGLRKAQAISVVHLAVWINLDGLGRVESARIAVGSVAPTIIRLGQVEALLKGRMLDAELIAEAAALAGNSISPIDDLRATADYRSDQLEVMVKRALSSLINGTQADVFPKRPTVLGGPIVVSKTAAISHSDGDIVTATVNSTEVAAPAKASETMLDWLRESVGLTGTKEGCAEGECGACTIHLDGTSVLSCLVPAARANGCEITTIEGLASDEDLHPLQAKFVSEAAVQCGYCIPGFLMAGASLKDDLGEISTKEMHDGLSGNLCRCTGYVKIEEAMK